MANRIASTSRTGFGRAFSTEGETRRLFPVTQPVEEIVAGLNALQPTILMAYASFLPRLVAETTAGRLRIAPRRVIAISEPLLPEIRAAVQDAWGVPVRNGYGMCEGVFTGDCGHGLHLPTVCTCPMTSACLRQWTRAGGRSRRASSRRGCW